MKVLSVLCLSLLLCSCGDRVKSVNRVDLSVYEWYHFNAKIIQGKPWNRDPLEFTKSIVTDSLFFTNDSVRLSYLNDLSFKYDLFRFNHLVFLGLTDSEGLSLSVYCGNPDSLIIASTKQYMSNKVLSGVTIGDTINLLNFSAIESGIISVTQQFQSLNDSDLIVSCINNIVVSIEQNGFKLEDRFLINLLRPLQQ